MGFSRSQSEAAIKKHGSVQSALDSLLAGVGKLHDFDIQKFRANEPIFSGMISP